MSTPEVGPVSPTPNPALRRTSPDRRRSRERRNAFEDAVRRPPHQDASDAQPAPPPQSSSAAELQREARDGRRSLQGGGAHVDVLA
jgi:hypothetical protein